MITTSPIEVKSERGQHPAGFPRLLGEVGDRLEAGIGEHRERQGEEEVVPALARREVEPVASTPGEKTHARPRTTTSICTPMSSAARTRAVEWIRVRRMIRAPTIRTMTPIAISTSHGLSLSDGAESDAAR